MDRAITKGVWSVSVLTALIFMTSVTGVADEEFWQGDRPAATGQAFESDGWRRDLITLREGELPVGKTRGFYWDRLADMGYTITAVNYDEPDYVEYEVVKGDRTYEVQIDIDEDTKRATDIDVAPNIWKTDATERALALNRWGANVDLPDLILVRSYEFSDRDRGQMERIVQELKALPVGQVSRVNNH